MSSDRRLLKVPSEAYVYAEIDPNDVQASASSIMAKLAGFRSFTYLHPFEEVGEEEAPAEVRQHFETGDLAVYAAVPEQEEGEADDESPVCLHFQGITEPEPGEWVCRLHSATYVMVETPAGAIHALPQREIWRSLKQQLGGPQAISMAEPDVDVLPIEKAPEDVRLWVLYGAADRVVVPLWPPEEIDEPERVMAWREAPSKLEEPQPYRGAYVRVVAVHPEHLRGMLCRRWHARRDDKSGIGTVHGRYPVDVAVATPSEKRTPHIHSFDSVSAHDWRPGLVFYSKTDSDGCPLSYVGDRLEQYYTASGWVPEPTWRSWLEDEDACKGNS